jgi:hypothetical protein
MPKGGLNLSYVGSFQTGTVLTAEQPIEEVWSWVERLGITSFVKGLVNTSTVPIETPWDDWAPYAMIRMRQAVEFRRASRSTTLPTRPLLLYYAFLNLTRGGIALETHQESTAKHGLRFAQADDLMASKAVVTPGTFSDYLRVAGANSDAGEWSLQESLSYIPEIGDEFVSLNCGPGRAPAVLVSATTGGDFLLRVHYPWDVTGFRAKWMEWYPHLATVCQLEGEGTTLRVTDGAACPSAHAVGEWLSKNLWINLLWGDRPVWYLPARSPRLLLPRAAYYLLAMFILGSVVRYEPELAANATNPDSHVGWSLRRFCDAAERFYPQLIFHWLFTNRLFFTAG